jgi:hypothetical protein
MFAELLIKKDPDIFVGYLMTFPGSKLSSIG